MDTVIIIPIYKPFAELSAEEVYSLKQLNKIVSNRLISFISHTGLQTSNYINLFSNNRVSVKEFDKEFFTSRKGYNKLCISPHFYKAYRKYKHMFIYQPDAFIFKNELDFWCSQKDDYIGAPWFELIEGRYTNKFSGVGNGGFSLRSIKQCLKLVNRVNIYNKLIKILQPVGLNKISTAILKKFRVIDLNLVKQIAENKFNEDYVFGILSKKILKNFIVATPQKATKFSFEINASQLYTLNNYELPFGCHAWFTVEPEFWKQFININQHDNTGPF